MNGAQDMGGQMGFGPVVQEKDEPLFHAPWERRALGLVVVTGTMGHWNLDITRHARESLPPAEYLSSSYYAIWIKGLEKVLVQSGLVSRDELAASRPLHPPKPLKRRVTAAEIPAVLAKGSPYDRPATAPAALRIGDPVRCRNDHVTTHTRLPRYIRGRAGTVTAVRGCFVLPDTNAHGQGECPTWCYGVRFDARELWGAGADPATEVIVDCWEPYLERG
jgi:nitrile hydratase subunit beta